MRRWPAAEESASEDRLFFLQQSWTAMTLGCLLGLALLFAHPASASALEGTSDTPRQQAKPTSPHVRSAMAVLATLQQAAVLPPEGTREADRVIQAVIQLQSVFAKGTDPSIQEFARRALADKHGEQAATRLEQFRTSGWTSDMLEALADADMNAQPDERAQLAMGLKQFNLSVNDFQRFMQLVRDGRSALTTQGLAFAEVYTHHRSQMPGTAGR